MGRHEVLLRSPCVQLDSANSPSLTQSVRARFGMAGVAQGERVTITADLISRGLSKAVTEHISLSLAKIDFNPEFIFLKKLHLHGSNKNKYAFMNSFQIKQARSAHQQKYFKIQ